MFERIILHIGATKTGTSAIQTGLARNRNLLLENGIYYPQGATTDKAEAGKVSGGNNRTITLLHKKHRKTGKTSRNKLRTFFKETATATDAKTLLLSGEAMGGYKAEFLNTLSDVIKEFTKEVRIIYYVRHLSGHAASQYSEYVKRRGMTKALRQYASNYSPSFLDTLNNFEATFGRDAIQVRLYDEVKKDLLTDFSTAIGLKNGVELEQVESVNRSLTYKEQEVLRRLNKVGANRTVLAKLSQHIISAPARENSRQSVPSDLFDKMEKNNLEVLDFINSHYASGWALKISAADQIGSTDGSDAPGFDETDEYYIQMLESVLSNYARVGKKQAKRPNDATAKSTRISSLLGRLNGNNRKAGK